MRLFHFSEDPSIEVFVPRPVRVPSARPAGREWLNGPLVWAIGEARQSMYLFPRDCPRILVWPTVRSSPDDIAAHRLGGSSRMAAYVEAGWLDRIASAVIHRYELPPGPFEDLDDAGMWVSRRPVRPLAMATILDLPAALHAEGAELRPLPSLGPLRGVWDTSLHASGIRLRNAIGWNG